MWNRSSSATNPGTFFERIGWAARSAKQLRTRFLTPSEIGEQETTRWRDLARRSCHFNPFILPDFLQATWTHFGDAQSQRLCVVDNPADGRWLAAGSFSRVEATHSYPYPHWVASQSLFSYRTGILLDAEWAPLAFDAFLSAWTSQSDAHAVLEWPGLRLDSILAREMRGAAQRLGHAWCVTGSKLVPCVFPEIVSDDYLQRHWSKSRRKTFRRDRKRLEETGPVSLRLVRDPAEIGPALETFLRLEQDSWKGDEGTACVSNTRDAAFIRDVIHRLALRDHVVISELRTGEHVVASAINFVTGPKLYAFKIGWDKNHAAASPGALHEAELLLASQSELRDFSIFDSCATEDSYIAPIWPERIPVGIALVVLAPHRNWNWLMLNAGRTLKRLVKRPC